MFNPLLLEVSPQTHPIDALIFDHYLTVSNGLAQRTFAAQTEEGLAHYFPHDGKIYTPAEFSIAYAHAYRDPRVLYSDMDSFTLTNSSTGVLSYQDECFDLGQNHQGQIRLFSEGDPKKTLVITSPGWGGESLPRVIDICSKLTNSYNTDAMLMDLPFQGGRTLDGFRSGELYISQNLLLTVHNFMQASRETMATIKHAKEVMGYETVVLAAFSGGALANHLTYAFSEEVGLDGYIPIMTGAGYADITQRGRYTKGIIEFYKSMGMDSNYIDQMWKLTDIRYHAHLIHSNLPPVMQVLLLCDDVVPTDNQMELAEIFSPNMQYLMKMPNGHASWVFQKQRIVEWIGQFVEEIHDQRYQ